MLCNNTSFRFKQFRHLFLRRPDSVLQQFNFEIVLIQNDLTSGNIFDVFPFLRHGPQLRFIQWIGNEEDTIHELRAFAPPAPYAVFHNPYVVHPAGFSFINYIASSLCLPVFIFSLPVPYRSNCLKF